MKSYYYLKCCASKTGLMRTKTLTVLVEVLVEVLGGVSVEVLVESLVRVLVKVLCGGYVGPSTGLKDLRSSLRN